MAKQRIARHPGIVLNELFLIPRGLNATRLAVALRVTPCRMISLIAAERGMTAETAMRLARFFSTEPAYWMDLQTDYELAEAEKQWRTIVDEDVQPLKAGMPIVIDCKPRKRKAPASAAPAVDIEKELAKLSEREKQVYELLSEEEYIQFDFLYEKAHDCGAELEVGELSGTLVTLELGGLVRRTFGDRYRKTKAGEPQVDFRLLS